MNEVRISHADLTYVEEARDHATDFALARKNLDKLYPGGDRNDELASRLSDVVSDERSRRNAHYYRYRLMLNIKHAQPLFVGEPENLAEASLLDFETRIKDLDDAGHSYVKALGGKGISAELGHVDQLGDWESGNCLDTLVRALPDSPALDKAGFVFGDTYDAKDKAKINYSFYLGDNARNLNKSIKGARKRAAADIIDENGNIYEIVKHSTFSIDVRELTRPQVALLDHVMKIIGNDEPKTKQDVARMNEAGQAIIEPFIADKNLKHESTAAVAASSLYFALHRFRED